MSFNLSYERISLDFCDTLVTKETSYTKSYSHFVAYFENIDKIELHNLVIGSHFVYGWMPTIINLNLQKQDEVLSVLNDAKKGRVLIEPELNLVKVSINNSMVGASKLLHFINPDTYAIWDSRIFRYVTGKSTQYGIDKVSTYLWYLSALNKIRDHENYLDLHKRVEASVKMNLSHMRAIEMIMFAKTAKDDPNIVDVKQSQNV